jgi:hypothetical protein
LQAEYASSEARSPCSWLEALRSRIPKDPRPVRNPSRFVLFLVDDNLFVRPFRLDAAGQSMALCPEAVGFSLRLGRNTTQCYILDRAQSLPDFQSLPSGVLRYDWTHADGDFGYPLEISSSMYPLETVVRLLERLSFSDPNTLESRMSLQASRLARHLPLLLCYEQSVAFSAPLNRVQNVYANREASAAELSPEVLADMFDRGQRIKIAAFNGFVPSACHQEVGLDFEERDE